MNPKPKYEQPIYWCDIAAEQLRRTWHEHSWRLNTDDPTRPSFCLLCISGNFLTDDSNCQIIWAGYHPAEVGDWAKGESQSVDPGDIAFADTLRR